MRKKEGIEYFNQIFFPIQVELYKLVFHFPYYRKYSSKICDIQITLNLVIFIHKL